MRVENTSNCYYPFGMLMPNRSFSAIDQYRFGFNGKLKDDDIKGDGIQYDYGFRIYDSRLGRFLSIDPLYQKFPELSSYQFASNTPIVAIDLDGEESKWISITVKYGQYTSDGFTGKINLALGLVGKTYKIVTRTTTEAGTHLNTEDDFQGSLTKTIPPGPLGKGTLITTTYIMPDGTQKVVHVYGEPKKNMESATGIQVWGSGDGSETPGPDAKKVIGNFDYGKFSEMIEPVLIAVDLDEPDLNNNNPDMTEKAVNSISASKDVYDDKTDQAWETKTIKQGSIHCSACGNNFTRSGDSATWELSDQDATDTVKSHLDKVKVK